MARIRTVKPEFFRHEKLQAMGALSMLIFEGLWTQCDKAGRFAWKPRILKLDILPFIEFDMEKELDKLADGFFVIKYESEGEFYGVVPTFGEHQRVSGKEAQEPAKHPTPPEAKPKKTRKLPQEKKGSTGEALGKQLGSVGDHPESQEGNGVQEEEREQEEEGKTAKIFFDEARQSYPGTKRGLDVEWANFVAKYPDYRNILPFLTLAIQREANHKALLRKTPGAFCPEWKNFQTWINQQCWTQEFGAVIAAAKTGFGAPPPTTEQLQANMDAVFGRTKGIDHGF